MDYYSLADILFSFREKQGGDLIPKQTHLFSTWHSGQEVLKWIFRRLHKYQISKF